MEIMLNKTSFYHKRSNIYLVKGHKKGSGFYRSRAPIEMHYFFLTVVVFRAMGLRFTGLRRSTWALRAGRYSLSHPK